MSPISVNQSGSTLTFRLFLVAILLIATSHPARSTTSAKPMTRLRANARNALNPVADIPLPPEDGWTAIKTDQGILFVWNVGSLYFTLSINGKEIKPIDDPKHIFFMVDGRPLQIQVAAIDNFAPDAKDKKLDERAILAAHRDWEAKFVEEMLNSKLIVRTFNAKLSNGNDASMWQFDMPESLKSTATKQLYLTVVTKDHVLLLNTEATATISDADGRKFLLDTMATLKVSPTPIDVDKLSEAIRKGERW
jgi:hypothetical protein